jgi:hypothetical protein
LSGAELRAEGTEDRGASQTLDPLGLFLGA